MIPRTFTPPQQAGLVFGAALLLMLGGVALDKLHLFTMDPLYPWTIATAFMLLFAMLNSISSLKSGNFSQYWGASMYSYLALGAATALSAWACSGVPLNEAQSYKFIYIVVTFGFLVFLSMVNLMRKIVNFAEREEWNQPRKRNR